MKTAKLFVIGLVLTSFVIPSAEAQNPLKKLLRGNKTATVQDLQLNEKAGPWLILCASFSGEEGRLQAERLAQELRENKYNAYTFSHKFDHTQKAVENGIGWKAPTKAEEELLLQRPSEKLRARKIEMIPANNGETQETAVLIGNYPSIDDGRAQRALKIIKTIKPQTMTNSTLSDTMTRRGVGDNEEYGPLRAAFLMPNPMLPAAYFEASKIDDHIVKANRLSKFSLLDNPGTYTVKIATFATSATFEKSIMKQRQAELAWKKKNNKLQDSAIVAATKKAEVLAAYLRKKKGIEAYTFHDRTESGVYVGSFDYLVKEGGINGRTENPEVIRTIRKFAGQEVVNNGNRGHRTYELPKKLHVAGINCDVVPVPVIVPKAPERTSGLLGRLRR